jgi:SNF2 family DNA or RNA helicase
VKTYGKLAWAVRPEDKLPLFGMQVVPHVAIKAKRLFPRVEQERTGLIVMLDTPEVAADLTWFTGRYPLEMDAKTRDRLAARATEHHDYMASIEDLLAGRRTLDEFPPPARPAREYQQIAADLAYLTGGLLLGDEVGLGKTQSALMLLRDPTTLPALLVVPTHLPKQWLRELGEVLPHLKGHIISRNGPVINTKTGSKPYDLGDADVLIMSYSKLAGWRDHFAGRIKTVIFDEVQELRHEGTMKYGAAAAIADAADRRMGLSATPIYNYGGEAFAIFEVLKPGVLGTRAEFFREWGGSVRSTGQVVVRDPGALGEYLRDQGLLLRRTRADVGRELPAPTEIVMEVPSDTDETDRAMGDIVALAEKVLHGDKTERFTASGQIDMLLRKATGVDKAPYVAEFVRFLLESEDKVVLFGWHRDVYDVWLEQLWDLNPVMYTGSESAKQKDDAVQRFLTDPTCRVFICSLRSGAGLDGLQEVASAAVFGELDWSPAMHHQAIGRLARDGQLGSVVAYYLVSEVGSDPVIAGVLEEKRQQAEPFMAGDDGTLFTATKGGEDRAKQLARTILARADEGHAHV